MPCGGSVSRDAGGAVALETKDDSEVNETAGDVSAETARAWGEVTRSIDAACAFFARA